MHNYGRFLIALVCDINISRFLVVFDYLRLVSIFSRIPWPWNSCYVPIDHQEMVTKVTKEASENIHETF